MVVRTLPHSSDNFELSNWSKLGHEIRYKFIHRIAPLTDIMDISCLKYMNAIAI